MKTRRVHKIASGPLAEANPTVARTINSKHPQSHNRTIAQSHGPRDAEPAHIVGAGALAFCAEARRREQQPSVHCLRGQRCLARSSRLEAPGTQRKYVAEPLAQHVIGLAPEIQRVARRSRQLQWLGASASSAGYHQPTAVDDGQCEACFVSQWRTHAHGGILLVDIDSASAWETTIPYGLDQYVAQSDCHGSPFSQLRGEAYVYDSILCLDCLASAVLPRPVDCIIISTAASPAAAHQPNPASEPPRSHCPTTPPNTSVPPHLLHSPATLLASQITRPQTGHGLLPCAALAKQTAFKHSNISGDRASTGRTPPTTHPAPYSATRIR